MYTVKDRRGNEYQFSQDVETFDSGDGWSAHGGGHCHSDGASLVATRELAKKEGVAFGRGDSENPDEAEAWFYFDPQNGTPELIKGSYEVVVVNAAMKSIATIARGRTDEANRGDPSTDDLGQWGIPMSYRAIQNDSGEILGGKGHQLGLMLQTDDGTDTFNVANSTMKAMGYKGRLTN